MSIRSKKAGILFISTFAAVSIALAFFVSRNTKLSPQVLGNALEARAHFGFSPETHPYIIIIDYGRPLHAKRLWLFEADTGRVILNAHVSHAWKSGLAYVENFSNKPGSELSCRGAFLTGEILSEPVRDFDADHGTREGNKR